MKTEQMLKKMGEISPEFIEEAEPKRRRPLLSYAAAAAAVLLVLFGVTMTLKRYALPGTDGMQGGSQMPGAEDIMEHSDGSQGPTNGEAPTAGETFTPSDALPGSDGAPDLIAEAAERSDTVLLAICTGREGLAVSMEPEKLIKGGFEGGVFTIRLDPDCGEDPDEPHIGGEYLVFLGEAGEDGVYEPEAVICREGAGVRILGAFADEGTSFETIIDLIERTE